MIIESAINSLLFNNSHFKFLRFHNKITQINKHILVLFLREINKQITAVISAAILYLH